MENNKKQYLSDILKYPWACWCFSLSCFSFLGMFYTGKYILFDYRQKRIFDTDAGLWYQAFIISKLPELLDTVFIVVRSKPLVALQWYHHWATMIICWYISYSNCDYFVFFFFMNYLVHFFMYAYFGLYCFLGNKIKYYGTFVNIIQIVQMFLAVCIAIYLYCTIYGDYSRCDYIPSVYEMNMFCVLSNFMYVSYFVLFLQFFHHRQSRIAKYD